MAVGAVAVASGLLPGGNQYSVGGSSNGEQVRADGAPELREQGGSTAEPTDEASAAPTPSRTSAGPSQAPRKAASPAPAKPPAAPPKATKAPAAPPKAKTPSKAPTSKAPVAKKTTEPTAETPAAPNSAAAGILTLVNQEREKVGCEPLRADASLDSLAQNFSDDMAARDFFDHTDPDGATPWDRADAAGVEGLGGENIARGQADAKSVMESWMNSEGHRANILNCDYTRLGVGVHTGTGGPWWTQDFGF
jgi:uncharacterized protein YkwD